MSFSSNLYPVMLDWGMTTTIELPEPLYQSARRLALAENRPLSLWIGLLLISSLETLLSQRREEDFIDWRDELLK